MPEKTATDLVGTALLVIARSTGAGMNGRARTGVVGGVVPTTFFIVGVTGIEAHAITECDTGGAATAGWSDEELTIVSPIRATGLTKESRIRRLLDETIARHLNGALNAHHRSGTTKAHAIAHGTQ